MPGLGRTASWYEPSGPVRADCRSKDSPDRFRPARPPRVADRRPGDGRPMPSSMTLPRITVPRCKVRSTRCSSGPLGHSKAKSRVPAFR